MKTHFIKMILFVSNMMRSSLAGLKHDPHKVAIMDSNSISATIYGGMAERLKAADC